MDCLATLLDHSDPTLPFPLVLSLPSFRPSDPPSTKESAQEFDLASWRSSRVDALARLAQHLETGSATSDGNAKHLVLVDDNMYYRSMRKRFLKHILHEYRPRCVRTTFCLSVLKVARTFTTGFVSILIETSLETALKRNTFREGLRRVPEHVIHRMKEVIESPGKRIAFQYFDGWFSLR